MSINVSGHKYGLAYPGVGWALWRSSEFLPEDLVFRLSYLGKSQESYTLNFTRGSSHVIAQYCKVHVVAVTVTNTDLNAADQFTRLGRGGYTQVIKSITRVALYLSEALRGLGFSILSKPNGIDGIPVVAFKLDLSKHVGFDEFDVSHALERKGWLVPAYHMAEGARQIKLLRAVCRVDFTQDLCKKFLRDCTSAMQELRVHGGKGFGRDEQALG